MEKSNLAIYQKYLELIYYTNDLVRKYPLSSMVYSHNRYL